MMQVGRGNRVRCGKVRVGSKREAALFEPMSASASCGHSREEAGTHRSDRFRLLAARSGRAIVGFATLAWRGHAGLIIGRWELLSVHDGAVAWPLVACTQRLAMPSRYLSSRSKAILMRGVAVRLLLSFSCAMLAAPAVSEDIGIGPPLALAPGQAPPLPQAGPL